MEKIALRPLLRKDLVEARPCDIGSYEAEARRGRSSPCSEWNRTAGVIVGNGASEIVTVMDRSRKKPVMRYKSRKLLGCFVRNSGPFFKLALCITLITLLIMILNNRSYIRELRSKYYFIPKNPRDFTPVISIEELRNNVSLSIWRTFDGYDSAQAKSSRNPPDLKMFDKLQSALTFFKHPLFRLKTNGSVRERHPWKFEKIIHQTWITEEIPGRTAPWVKKWLEKNPDWTYMFWTDLSSRLFIQEHFPSLLPVYDSWTVPVQRADMFRYIALFAFGGIYADLDMEVLRSLEGIREWSSCILSREPELQTYIMSNFMNCFANNYTFTCNAFMGCRSHHPFLYYTIARTVQKSPLVRGQHCPLNDTIWCTGPAMMSFAYGFYRRSISDSDRFNHPDWDVICPDYEWFLPTFDESRLNLVKRGCRMRRMTRKQRKICEVYKQRGQKNEPLDYSYTTHHWFHSYHYNVNKDKVNIATITENLRWDKANEEKYFDISYIGV